MAESVSPHESEFDAETYVDQMAALIGLPLPAETRAGVIENVQRMQAIAPLVLEFPLPDDLEIAPVFEP